ncbi:2,3-dimethylmalate lyase [Vitis vinifera]|uniref:2,3-dimethylmalate lyase n=1 Tax=Vitis vinifera TaxID=29760 RepID=A0A438G5K4_VITVI|nr:2,3-dimethylmalate lyase [Vitis vinifera]
MLDQGRQITQAVSIPVIGDGDNGYGNAMNVKRTVKDFIRAGFAGIILEDQADIFKKILIFISSSFVLNNFFIFLERDMRRSRRLIEDPASASSGENSSKSRQQMGIEVSPKACGHTRGRKVVSREEAVMRIKAAIDARKETGSDIVIVARTDSRQAVSFDESLWRSRAFASAGADVLFIDALSSREEMKAFCEIAPFVPKMDGVEERLRKRLAEEAIHFQRQKTYSNS